MQSISFFNRFWRWPKIPLSMILGIVASSLFSNNIPQTLDSYFQEKGIFLSPIHSVKNEGYSSEAQRQAFAEDCKTLPHAATILEIGFNGGHSCETFLLSLPEASITSFDIGTHFYTPIGVDFMRITYPNRFYFVQGDSAYTIPTYAAQHPEDKFDLIFIDGCHEYNAAVKDIQNCQLLAHENTVLWIDDYAPSGVKAAVDACVHSGLIEILNVKSTQDASGSRNWAIAKYRFLSPSEQVFTTIYEQGLWGIDANGLGTSGPGSTLPQGQPFIDYVQNFLDTHPDVHRVVDVGCGDWVLAKFINWNSCHYLGTDVVKTVIENNHQCYATDTIQFMVLDAISQPLPSGDLLICKDVLMHLPNESIQKILLKSKQFKYCILIHDVNPKHRKHPRRRLDNTDISLGDFRNLDLTLPPFNLSPKAVSYYESGSVVKQVLLIENQ